MSDGGEPLLAGRDDVEGGDVVADGEEARVVLSEVRRQRDLEPRAVDDVAVQPRVVVVHLRKRGDISGSRDNFRDTLCLKVQQAALGLFTFFYKFFLEFISCLAAE